jgi:hypothetical protein
MRDRSRMIITRVMRATATAQPLFMDDGDVVSAA